MMFANINISLGGADQLTGAVGKHDKQCDSNAVEVSPTDHHFNALVASQPTV